MIRQKRKLKKLLNPKIMNNSLSKKMFAIGSLGLIGVYCLQFFGFSPCDLCVKQRILVGILIGVSALSLVFKKNLDILITICLTAMLGLAIFHVGVEHKIFELPSSCANKIGLDGGMDAMRAMLLDPANIKPACDVPQILFGLSVAIWSLLGVLFLYLLTARHWFLRFKK